ncbi:MFS transporter [Corynebacterium guangdongense]|uniref:MFS family permease n=1 Tax=Corynebacterium guangdongense TaxID=1783348 RepID=A0ABU1ZYT8_9CORY|nr:MFS transporter [Corynebacterium guangdongense]MDR7330099.1 MFS family permease [Corynebacterium guangdongense]WJZ18657.1 Fosmidomycin resistance protein [Corynebacterium guangdongense]
MSLTTAPRLGLRVNAAQFSLLVLVNALVGGMVGQQQAVLPLLAREEFGMTGYTLVFTYIGVFGLAKVIANWFAGALSDRYGRKPILIVGWLIALPVPIMLILAPSWGWVVAANLLLGVNQGLTWSTTVVMKIDLAGPARRGLAMGLNEAAGYAAVALTSFLAGQLAANYGLRPAPFLLGLAYAVVALGLSVVFVRETRGHAALEGSGVEPPKRSSRDVFLDVSLREPALSTASAAGLVNNLNFGLSWGVFPLLFASADLSLSQIGVLFAVYPAVWGLGQLFTGAASDRYGRKPFITVGMAVQALGLGIVAFSGGFAGWALGAAVLGAGTALVYPTLLAVIGDVSHPAQRGRAVGVYRVWRDLGYVAGALVGGVVADLAGLDAAVWSAMVISAVAAVIVHLRMYETHLRN